MSLIPEVTMLVLSSAAGWFNPIPYGDYTSTDRPANALRISYANDESFNHDQNYTQGARLDYCFSYQAGSRMLGLSLSQYIYTPEVHATHAIPGQHPYAGTSALGVAWGVMEDSYGLTMEFQVGTTGDPSLARHCQNGVHRMLGMETWDGWDDQVPAEVTFQLTTCPAVDLPFLKTDLGGGWSTDALLFSRVETGTVRMAGGAGVGFRIGKNLPESSQIIGGRAGIFGKGPINRSGYRVDAPSYYLVANVYGEYVGRDITIDGGVFRDFERTCSRKTWQVEGSIGLGVSYHNIDYFAGMRIHSRSYCTQKDNSAMGVFSIGWRW